MKLRTGRRVLRRPIARSYTGVARVTRRCGGARRSRVRYASGTEATTIDVTGEGDGRRDACLAVNCRRIVERAWHGPPGREDLQWTLKPQRSLRLQRPTVTVLTQWL